MWGGCVGGRKCVCFVLIFAMEKAGNLERRKPGQKCFDFGVCFGLACNAFLQILEGGPSVIRGYFLCQLPVPIFDWSDLNS